MFKRFLAVFGLILLFMAVWGGILIAVYYIFELEGDEEVAGIVVASSMVPIFGTFIPLFNLATKWGFRFKGEGAPIPLEQLREKIKEINTYNVPVMVTEKKGKLIVTWKYVDAKWWIILAKTGLKELYELHIKFNDKKKKVTLIDVQKTVDWEAGPYGVKIRGGYFRGVMMQYTISKAWGIKENFKFGKIYDYKFRPSEIKNPVLNTILRSGWDVNFGLW